jgi:membrane-associated phospholipid phosphatase
MRGASKVAGAGALCVVLCLFCIAFVDRPVEVFVHAHQGLRPVFQAMAAPSLISLPAALVYLAVFALRAAVAPGRREWRWLSLCAAVLAATAMKDELKWVFGRPWPDSWVEYGLYAFKPFIDSEFYGGFPSGHTAYMAAPMFMLCWLVPKYRAVWLAAIGMVMFGLVAAGYHYVSDTIAGAFVGLAAAAGTVALMPARVKAAALEKIAA